jgi:hypothetical protein
MGKQKITAKEIVSDLRVGLTYGEIMEKGRLRGRSSDLHRWEARRRGADDRAGVLPDLTKGDFFLAFSE